MAGRPTVLDRPLLKVGLKLVGESRPSRVFDYLESDRPDPTVQFTLLHILGLIWCFASGLYGVACVAIVSGLEALHLIGRSTGADVLLFGCAFCIAGACDALWRHVLVWEARKRYRRANHTLDDTGRGLMRLAQINDGTILIQLAAGLVFAFHVWSRVW